MAHFESQAERFKGELEGVHLRGTLVKGYKEYAKKTRLSSRKNTSTDLDEAVDPEESTN